MGQLEIQFENQGKMWGEFGSRVSDWYSPNKTFNIDGHLTDDIASDVVSVSIQIEEHMENVDGSSVSGGKPREILKEKTGFLLSLYYESKGLDVLDVNAARSVAGRLRDNKKLLSLEKEDIDRIIENSNSHNFPELDTSKIGEKDIRELEERIIERSPWYYNKYLCEMLVEDRKESVLDDYITTCRTVVSGGDKKVSEIVNEIVSDADDEDIKTLVEDTDQAFNTEDTSDEKQSTSEIDNNIYGKLYHQAVGKLDEMTPESMLREFESVDFGNIDRVDRAEKIQLAKSYMKEKRLPIKQNLEETIEEHGVEKTKGALRSFINWFQDRSRSVNESYAENSIKTVDGFASLGVINSILFAGTPITIAVLVCWALWFAIRISPHMVG